MDKSRSNEVIFNDTDCKKNVPTMDNSHFQKFSNTILLNYIFQLGSTIVTLNGQTTVGYGENSTVLATFGELDPALLNVPDSRDPLMLNITDRYSVEGSHDDISFDYTFTIKSK